MAKDRFAERNKRILELYERYSEREICQRLGVTQSVVAGVVRRAGKSRRRSWVPSAPRVLTKKELLSK
jgi:transposase